jgi:hypothetical protein
VIRWLDHQRIIPAGDRRVSSSGMWTLAPPARYGQSSQIEASKAGLAICVPRSDGATE